MAASHYALIIHQSSVSTDSNMLAELSFRAISPATSSQRGFVCSQVHFQILAVLFLC